MPQGDLDLLRSSSDFQPPVPETIVDERHKTLRRRQVTEYLIRWKGKTAEDDTWEQEFELRKRFPNFFKEKIKIRGKEC